MPMPSFQQAGWLLSTKFKTSLFLGQADTCQQKKVMVSSSPVLKVFTSEPVQHSEESGRKRG